MKNILLALVLSMGYTSNVLAEGGAATGQSPYGQIIFLAGFILIFYFLLIRPQSKRHKAHQAMVQNIVKDDEVVTTGGLVGRVSRIADQFLVLSIADGIEVKVQRHAVANVLPKGTMKSI